DEQIASVEKIVNDNILLFTDVNWKVMPIDEAKKLGAMMLFGEKYGSEVRVVTVPGFSMEFCGGTHVSNIGQIGSFKILSETGVAAGVRRIEAVTGMGISERLKEEEETIQKTAAALKANPRNLVQRAEALAEENRALKKELEELKAASRTSGLSDMISSARDIDGVKLICKQFDGVSIDELRSISDEIKKAQKSVVMVFASTNGPKVTLMASVTDDLLEKGYHAGNMIKKIAAVCGGGGGGKADMAQAGAKDASKLPEAFALAEELVRTHQ
ncbi:MAG: alanine--tRNA ligase, partial [Firmicutes bacterium]|nr:alanine--tRNA ligase [Bacillota bacterium]